MPSLQTSDIETYYEKRGEGPPIIFIHGAMSDHTATEQQLEAFGEAYTVIAYDVRGHGRTENLQHRPYSIDLLAEDLYAFVSTSSRTHSMRPNAADTMNPTGPSSMSKSNSTIPW